MQPMLDNRSDAAARAAGFLRTLAHEGRLRIVCALLDGEHAATELARRAGIAAAALSQQAALLEAGGIITRRRSGRSVVYRLAAPEARQLTRLLYRIYCQPAARRRGGPTPRRT